MTSPPRARREPRELDDATLARARRGDPAAFRTLVERHADAVHALLFRMVEARLGAGRVDDLAQDTFVRVHGALPRFEPAGPARLSTWILTIATRIALNALRDARPTEPLAAAAAVPAGESTDAALDRHRRAARLRRALASLSPDQRAVIVLREYHDLDYNDIAHTLELEIGTVKSRLSRARNELRRLLEDEDA